MSKHRIVLIEDNEADVWVLKSCLEAIATDHEIVILKDGEEALRFVEAEREGVEPRPCVIVLDLYLPKHDGLEILAAIRRAPALKYVTALIVSTMPSPEMQRRIRELGGDFTEKPQTISGYDALATRIWQLCESTFGAAV
jgi:CheY-like chemotaxis protein